MIVNWYIALGRQGCVQAEKEEGNYVQLPPTQTLPPRPSHHPAYDHLQYTKQMGENLSIYHMSDITVYLLLNALA